MFKTFLLFSLAAVALCQMGMGMGHWWQQIFGDQDVIDSIHGFKVQYDDAHDIVIFVNTDDCYIVEAHPEQAWDTLVSHEDDLHRFTEAVYEQVQAGQGITSMTHEEASEAYHSHLETWECARKNVHKVDWTPSEAGGEIGGEIGGQTGGETGGEIGGEAGSQA